MRGSTTAFVIIICAGLAIVAILWSVHRVLQMSQRVETFETLRGTVAELEAAYARLEGENTRLRAETATLKDLATGRKDIQDLTQEIRTMVWMAYGPHEEAHSRAQRPQRVRDPADE